MSEFVSSVLRAVLGLGVFLGICWLISENRRRINWRLVGGGMSLQLILAVLILRVPFVETLFNAVARFFVDLLGFSREGAVFLFGDLVERTDTYGFIFAFQVLPTIVFFAAFSSILYYLGILQRIVFAFAWLMKKTMHLSGAESLATAANIFVGQTEAPLVIRPYLSRMSRSEIMTLMGGGMATIAGGVLVSYIGMLGGEDEAARLIFARHLLTASILSAPAAIVAAKMMVPETAEVMTTLQVPREKAGSNVLDAATSGMTDGVKLAVNVAGALLVFTALVALLNFVLLNWIGGLTGLNSIIISATNGAYEGLTLQFVLGVLFAPASWLIGISGEDVMAVGQLLGERMVLNEFFAYATLADMKASGTIANPRSITIATYALCGFANVVSMGIQVGGIGALAPDQRKTLAALAFRAMLAGTFACMMTACIAAFLV